MAKKRSKMRKRTVIVITAIALAIIIPAVILFLDFDGDGLSNFAELRAGTSMFNSDSDGDGLNDGLEVNTYQTKPAVVDSDGDGLNDGLEVNTYGTNPLVSDTDGDGLNDGQEISLGANPKDTDTDDDGLADGSDSHPTTHEWKLMDSDGDGWSDYKEYYEENTDRLDSDTDNDGYTDSFDPHPTTHEWKLIDSDNDGWSDYKEAYETNTNRFNSDTDDDGAPDPYDAHPLSAALKIRRDYEWEYPAGKNWFWTVYVSNDLYVYYQGLERMNWSNWPQYTLDPTVKQLGSWLKEAADNEGFNYYETVDFVLDFVHSMPYTYDSVTAAYEYPRYPLETLVGGGGDCEDTSFLVAGILREMGYDVRLVYVPRHLAVAVWGHEDYPAFYYEVNGKNYYYCETTGDYWRMGELPSVFEGAQYVLYEIGAPTSLLVPPKPVVVANGSFADSAAGWGLEVYLDGDCGYTPGHTTSYDHTGDGGGSIWVYAEPGWLSTDEDAVYLYQDIVPIPAGWDITVQAWYMYVSKVSDTELDGEKIKIEILEGGVWKSLVSRVIDGSHNVTLNTWHILPSATYTTTERVYSIRIYVYVKDYEGLSGGEEIGICFDDISLDTCEIS